jgi:hypothetical protein
MWCHNALCWKDSTVRRSNRKWLRLKPSAWVRSFETFSLVLHTSVFDPLYMCLFQFTFHFLKILITAFCCCVCVILWSKWYKAWNSLCLALCIHWHNILLLSKQVLFVVWYNQIFDSLCKVRGSNRGGGEIFRTHPDQLWCPPSLLYSGYRVLPGGKAAGPWHWPPTSSVQVKERVELNL